MVGREGRPGWGIFSVHPITDRVRPRWLDVVSRRARRMWFSGQAVTEAGFAALASAGNETRVVGTLIRVGWSRSSIPDLKSSTISSVSCASCARTP